MGLFTFFKKKGEPEAVVIPNNSVKALADGILFEGEDIFLKWGADIAKEKYYTKKEYRADRTIYQWGEKTVLNGLQLTFKTVCWNHKQHGDIKSFESMEFSAEGGGAEANFQTIKNHLISILGVPIAQEEDLQPGDVSLQWKVKAVKVALNFFNKDQPKVHFEMGW